MAASSGEGARGRGLAGDLADVGRVLDELTDRLVQARSLPLSASCVVNRGEVLGLVEELRARLPEALGKAQDVLGDRAGVVDDGRREAERVLERAQAERHRLLAQTDVVSGAQGEAERVLQEAHARAQALRADAEDYVDATLATFEVVLTRTLQAVERGRQQLSGVSDLDALREADDDPPPLPG